MMKRWIFYILFLLPCFLQAQTPRLVVPIGHTKGVQNISFSPDGKYILTASMGGAAKMWDLRGRQIQSFQASAETGININFVYGSALFSKDGQYVLNCGNFSATLWNLQGQLIQSFIGHKGVVRSAAISADNQYILTGGTDSTIILWNRKGEPLRSFKGHKAEIYWVAFSPDGQYLVSSSRDQTAKVWSITGKLIQTIFFRTFVDSLFEEEENIIRSDFSADGKSVLLGFERVPLWPGDADNNRFSRRLNYLEKDSSYSIRFESGAILKPITSENKIFNFSAMAFSQDGKRILTGDKEGIIRMWGEDGVEMITLDGKFRCCTGSLAFSPDGKYILAGSWNGEIKIWDLMGRDVITLDKDEMTWELVDLWPSKHHLMLQKDSLVKIWDLSTNTFQIINIEEDAEIAGVSSDGIHFLTDGSEDRIWDLSGKKIELMNDADDEEPVEMEEPILSPDGMLFFPTYHEGMTKLWHVNGNKAGTFTCFSTNDLTPELMAVAPNGSHVAVGYDNGLVKLWNGEGREISTIRYFSLDDEYNSINIKSISFSPDGTTFMVGAQIRNYGISALFNLKGERIRTFFDQYIHQASFLQDGNFIQTTGNGWIRIRDFQGKTILYLKGNFTGAKVAYEPENHTLVIAGVGIEGEEPFYGIKKYDLSGRELQSMPLHKCQVISLTKLLLDKFVLLWNPDRSIGILDLENAKIMATIAVLDSADWVVTAPSGLFDASDGAKRLMYYVMDYEKEKIVLGLEQIQARYWQPGLLGSIMGLTPYPVRDVGVFDNLRLFPSIEDSTRIESGRLYIKLRERNGGQGKLSLIVNGITRAENINPERKKDLNIDLKRFSGFFRTDTLNTLELEVYESSDKLKSEPYKLYYQASVQKRGEGEEEKPLANDCRSPRHLYLIVVGTSLYPQGVDSLPSANEDALEMARVLQEAGKQLYDDRVHLKLLATKGGEPPSKANIAAAFEAFKSAGICDVLAVFFAGHGTNWGKDGDKSNFYYLTKDMTFGNLNDEGIRKAFAISDQELKDWMREIPAENKLMILDACNSGQAAINMGGIVARDMDPDKIIAFNEMSGNSGSYVISGSSESGASFESAVLGHGLLTYSLLEGINGTALEGSKINVLPLLLKSYKRVGELAQSLGQEQTPIIAKPRGNASFYVGRNDGSIKIDLPETKPMVIRSVFLDQNSYVDHLHIAEELNTQFRSKVIKGKQAPWFYSDIPEHPQGFSVRGTYAVQPDNKVIVCCSLVRGEMPVGEPFTIKGENSAKVLADLIYKAVRPGINLK